MYRYRDVNASDIPTPPDRQPPKPDRDDGDDDEAPETPPTEPEPLPIQEPPDAPGAGGPYVV